MWLVASMWESAHIQSFRGSWSGLSFSCPLWSPLMNLPRIGFVPFLPYVPTPPHFLGLPVMIVGSMCYFDWVKGCQIGSKTLFLGMAVRVSPEEISICIGRLRRLLSQLEQASFSLLRAWIEPKVEEGRTCLWLEWGQLSSPLDL